MVKRSRMTKKKTGMKSKFKKTTKSTKGKKVIAPKGRSSAKTDRANQATNKLLKSLSKKRGSR